MTLIYLIAAIDKNRGIGKDGVMPWNLKDDMRFFHKTTTKTKDSKKQNAVIMGRRTWESIPEKHRPLVDRKNIILTRNEQFKTEHADIFRSLDDAIISVEQNIEKVFIIGGESVYHQAIKRDDISGLYITRIHHHFEVDTFFPKIPKYFSKITKLGNVHENGLQYEYLLYEKGLV